MAMLCVTMKFQFSFTPASLQQKTSDGGESDSDTFWMHVMSEIKLLWTGFTMLQRIVIRLAFRCKLCPK
jgi:hypothetical protein